MLLLSLDHKYLLIDVLIIQSKTDFNHITGVMECIFTNSPLSFQERTPADRKWGEIFWSWPPISAQGRPQRWIRLKQSEQSMQGLQVTVAEDGSAHQQHGRTSSALPQPERPASSQLKPVGISGFELIYSVNKCFCVSSVSIRLPRCCR